MAGIPRIPGLNDSQNKVAWIIFQTLTTRYKASDGVACGIVGCAYGESRLNPDITEIGDGAYLGGAQERGWGLYQITYLHQKKRAWAWMDKHGGRGPIQQTVYAIEISNNSHIVPAHLREDRTPEEGCNYWYKRYEFPNLYLKTPGRWTPHPQMFNWNQHRDIRVGWANKVYKYFKGRGGEGLSEELQKMNKFDLGGPINGEDSGPKYVSFEENIINNFKGTTVKAPEAIAIHQITETASAKTASKALHKGQKIGKAGAEFHLVVDDKDAFLVVPLEKRVRHIQRTNVNESSLKYPNSQTISVGICTGQTDYIDDNRTAKATQVVAEVCHLLNLSADNVFGSHRFDEVADPKEWWEESHSLGGNIVQMQERVFQSGVKYALNNDIGGIQSATGQDGDDEGSGNVPIVKGNWCFPITNIRANPTSPFGPRGGGWHDGADFGSSVFTDPYIYAVHGGTVIHAGYGPASWSLTWQSVVIDTGEYHIVSQEFSFSPGSSHCLVKKGDKVRVGQKIARIDNSVPLASRHLHLGITKKNWLLAQQSWNKDDGTWLNPMNYIKRIDPRGVKPGKDDSSDSGSSKPNTSSDASKAKKSKGLTVTFKQNVVLEQSDGDNTSSTIPSGIYQITDWKDQKIEVDGKWWIKNDKMKVTGSLAKKLEPYGPIGTIKLNKDFKPLKGDELKGV